MAASVLKFCHFQWILHISISLTFFKFPITNFPNFLATYIGEVPWQGLLYLIGAIPAAVLQDFKICLLIQYTAKAAFALSILFYIQNLAHVLAVPKGIIYLKKGYYFLSKKPDVWIQIPRLSFLLLTTFFFFFAWVKIEC